MKISSIPAHPNILLYGYGAEGRSSEAWLKQHCPQAVVEVYEDKEERREKKEKEEADWNNYDVIVKSPGVPPRNIPSEFHARVTSNFRLFMENLREDQRQKIIGITGSKGKSTTTKFCHELLQNAGFKVAIIGNYGVPALEMWPDIDALDYIIAECSSFQLWDLQTSPHYAIFLSFFADHLDWHDGDEGSYFAAKSNLWRHQREEDYLLVPQEVDGEWLMVNGERNLVRTEAVPANLFPESSTLQAAHFRQNLGTVWALAQQLNIANLEKVWPHTAAHFEMIEHRLEKFHQHSGWMFYNDSIATSPDATVKAVEWLEKDLSALILDGQDTGVAGCQALVTALETHAPQALVAVVESDIATAFTQSAASSALQVQSFADYESALGWIQATAVPGAVLFSPGGKSFNRFKNYGERGQVFKELVLSLRG